MYKRMLALIVFSLLMSLGAWPVSATPAEQSPDAQPIVVLSEFNPWLTSIGSDAPTFALYDDGTVIYKQADESYVSAQLDDRAFSKLLDELNIGDAFFGLDNFYETVFYTDQPSSTIFAWRDGEFHYVSVYGDVRMMDEARNAAPKEYLRVFDQLATYENADAAVWLPEFVEVLLWLSEVAEGLAWPTEWPDLLSETTVQHENDTYSVFVPIEHFDELQAMHEKSVNVQLGERVYYYTWRWPFPAEAAWINPENKEVSDLAAEVEAWGGAVFSDAAWQFQRTQSARELSVVWQREEPPAVAYFAGDFAFDTYTVKQVDNFINNDWMEVTFINYDEIEFQTRCMVDHYVVVHLTAQDQGNDYVVRYWVWSEDGAFKEFFMTLLQDDAAELERHANQLFGDAASCERG